MTLAAKLLAFVVLGVIIVVAIDGYLSVRRETELFDADMERDALVLGRTLKDLTLDVWRTSGQKRAMELIEGADADVHLRVRWVWLGARSEDRHAPLASRDMVEPVVRGQEISFIERDASGGGHRYTYIPLALNEAHPAALELSESLSALKAYTAKTIRNAWILAGVVVVVSVSLAAVLGVLMIGRPLHKVAEKARKVGAGDLSQPLRLRGHDEFDEVATALNTTCEQLIEAHKRIRAETEQRIATVDQLRHADRLSTVGGLASGIAHELGTPLMVVSARAGLIASGEIPEDQVADSARIIKSESDRITKIVRKLLDFARRRCPVVESIDLRKLARRTLDLLANVAQREGKTLSLHGADSDGPADVRADAGQIEQVLTNLVTNALQAVPKGGRVEVGLDRPHVEPPAGCESLGGDCICIYVQDDGEGISDENIRHIFDPFFTTKDVGQGTGLGLSIAHGIVREHGGWIDVASKPGKGTRFSVYLPEDTSACRDES